MRVKVELWTRFLPYREPFGMSRGVEYGKDTIQVRLTDEDGHVGRGEAVGVTYAGETPAQMGQQIEAVKARLESGVSRFDLLDHLPHGGARMAVDSALWDLEAKRDGVNPFLASGVKPDPIVTMCSIGIKTPEGYAAAAARLVEYPLIKVKVDGRDPMTALAAVRDAAPRSQLVVDPNQGWSVDQLKAFAPHLLSLNVVLLEQPIPVGHEPGLDGWRCPVPLCADELINTERDLSKAQGRFDVINIKLDKAGGLTAALRLADAVKACGLDIMVGCMMGSSLSMAPAMVLAQRARFVDLDGPLLHSEDVEDGFKYENGRVAAPHQPHLWG